MISRWQSTTRKTPKNEAEQHLCSPPHISALENFTYPRHHSLNIPYLLRPHGITADTSLRQGVDEMLLVISQVQHLYPTRTSTTSHQKLTLRQCQAANIHGQSEQSHDHNQEHFDRVNGTQIRHNVSKSKIDSALTLKHCRWR